MENEYLLNKVIELLKSEAKSHSEAYRYTAPEAYYSQGYVRGLLIAVGELETYLKASSYLKH